MSDDMRLYEQACCKPVNCIKCGKKLERDIPGQLDEDHICIGWCRKCGAEAMKPAKWYPMSSGPSGRLF